LISLFGNLPQAEPGIEMDVFFHQNKLCVLGIGLLNGAVNQGRFAELKDWKISTAHFVVKQKSGIQLDFIQSGSRNKVYVG